MGQKKTVVKEVQSGYITTQRTAKKWKFLQLISVLAMIVGVILFFSAESGKTDMRAFLCIVFGFLGYLLARFCAWWCHG